MAQCITDVHLQQIKLNSIEQQQRTLLIVLPNWVESDYDYNFNQEILFVVKFKNT